MKILALGGSGGMGRFAVETAMHFDNIEKIIVADINEKSAIDFAKSMNEKVSGTVWILPIQRSLKKKCDQWMLLSIPWDLSLDLDLLYWKQRSNVAVTI
jgi:shikimate 5-dehydrogenase